MKRMRINLWIMLSPIAVGAFMGCIIGGIGSDVLGAETPAGDRHLGERLVFPPNVFLHNNPEGRVIDVTKPPFNAKGDGVTDDTKALIAAIDYVYNKKDFSKSLIATVRSNTLIIYIPNGTYLVSDTIVSSWPALLATSYKQGPGFDEHIIRVYAEDERITQQGVELNQYLHIYGESREGVTIRLKDNSPGFEKGNARPVVSFGKTLRGSNCNQSNYFENITIDTGRGNPGAAGLRWDGSNFGGVRNLTVISGDGEGYAGLMYDRKHACGYHRDITVQGFEKGLVVAGGNATSFAMEYVSFLRQKDCAIEINRGSRMSARKIMVDSVGQAVNVVSGHVVLIDSDLKCGSGRPAVEIAGPVSGVQKAHGFVRNVNVSGTISAIVKAGKAEVEGSRIEEYVSGQAVSLSGRKPVKSLGLEIKDTPRPPVADDLSRWAVVEDYGAKGDGITDDTVAIQKAADSGKPVIFFGKAEYVINGTVNLPASVRQMLFMHMSAVRVVPSDAGMFRISERSDEPIWILKNENVGGVFIDHEADRPLVIEDMRTRYIQSLGNSSYLLTYTSEDIPIYEPRTRDNNQWRPYRNTRPEGPKKTVFVNNAFNFSPGNVDGQYAPENVNLWARWVNPEQSSTMIAYRNSNVWIFSFKTENTPDIPIWIENCTLEILGGVVNQFNDRKENLSPIIRSIDSELSVVLTANNNRGPYRVILEDTKKGEVSRLALESFPTYRGNAGEPVIPLLTNQ